MRDLFSSSRIDCFVFVEGLTVFVFRLLRRLNYFSSNEGKQEKDHLRGDAGIDLNNSSLSAACWSGTQVLTFIRSERCIRASWLWE